MKSTFYVLFMPHSPHIFRSQCLSPPPQVSRSGTLSLVSLPLTSKLPYTTHSFHSLIITSFLTRTSYHIWQLLNLKEATLAKETTPTGGTFEVKLCSPAKLFSEILTVDKPFQRAHTHTLSPLSLFPNSHLLTHLTWLIELIDWLLWIGLRNPLKKLCFKILLKTHEYWAFG